MINLKAYKEWKDLFNENISNVWQEETTPLLKKIAMLLYSIKKEIKKIDNEVDKEVLNLRNKIIQAPNKQNILLEACSEGLSNNKENVKLKRNENALVDSPVLFQNKDAPVPSSNDSSSIIISDDETQGGLPHESPEIKRKKRNYGSQKHSQRWQILKNSKTSTFLKSLSTNQVRCDESVPPNAEKDESMEFLKGLINHNQVDDGDKKNREGDLVLTPVRSDCDADLSLVQCTPVQVSLPKKKDFRTIFLSKKSKREVTSTEQCKVTTLTKMSLGLTDKERSSRVQTPCGDSQETCFDPIQGITTSQTMMGITRMVSCLNSDSPLKIGHNTKSQNQSQEVVNLDPDSEEIVGFIDELGFEHFQDDTSLNSAIIEEKDEEEFNVAQGLNEFLAEAQNVPEKQLKPEPVVRGKARQKLPGWACNECEKFYLNRGLNSGAILALNKCSRHRGQYRPREDTLPGFWDMNVVSQETQNTK